jgi:hypothetical protein
MQNLLYNGDFENEFHPWRGTAELHMADGWTPWWVAQTGADPTWKNRRPEYKRATLAVDPGRIRNGASSQQYFTFWGTHVAGLWQQVVVEPGARLRFRAWGHAWSSEADRPRPSQNPTHVHMSIGIDPMGGTDPMSSSIVWSPDQSAIDDWRLFAVEAGAVTPIITVFFRSAPEWPKKHQDIYWDEATLEVLEEGPPGAPASGGDRQTEIETSPSAPEPGTETTVTVRSLVGHVYVSLVARGPEQEVLPVSGPSLGRQGDYHIWEFSFQPETKGTHTILFGSDAGSRVIRWARLPVGVEAPVPIDAGEEPPPAPPTVPPTPSPANRGAPRIQYGRTYVLLPPTADSVWAEAAMRGGFDARRTVGFSADDAGIGDLDERRVIAVNPHHWLNELTADWFGEHYPGVKYHSLVVNTPEELARALRNWRD